MPRARLRGTRRREVYAYVYRGRTGCSWSARLVGIPRPPPHCTSSSTPCAGDDPPPPPSPPSFSLHRGDYYATLRLAKLSRPRARARTVPTQVVWWRIARGPFISLPRSKLIGCEVQATSLARCPRRESVLFLFLSASPPPCSVLPLTAHPHPPRRALCLLCQVLHRSSVQSESNGIGAAANEDSDDTLRPLTPRDSPCRPDTTLSFPRFLSLFYFWRSVVGSASRGWFSPVFTKSAESMSV